MSPSLGLALLLAGLDPSSEIVRPGALEPVFSKMRGLAQGADLRVNIVHIGDSHVLEGTFTGELRRILQARFGGAGRGLVFPWEVGGGQSPKDFRSASNASWKARQVTTSESDIPAGVSGWGLLGPEGPFVLKLASRAVPAPMKFDLVRLFAEQGPGWAELEAASHPDPMVLEKTAPGYVDFLHTVQAGDTLYSVAKSWETNVAELKKANGLTEDRIFLGQTLRIKRRSHMAVKLERESFRVMASFRPSRDGGAVLEAKLPSATDHVFILPKRDSLPDDRTLLYGASLEMSGVPGVLYHALGVQGAEFRHFQRAPTFFVQLAELSPDLIVVSLGASEIARPGFNAALFREQVLSFVDTLREGMPGTAILLVSPPDTIPKKGAKSQAAEASRVLAACAAEREIPFWDLFAAMGGAGSMVLWRDSKWALEDGAHFNEAGYLKLGGEFGGDLMDAFEHP